MSDTQTDLKLEVQKPKVVSEEASRNFERVLDSREAAALLGIHPKTLQRLARSQQIPAARIGKSWAFRASALDIWLKAKLAG